MVTWTGAYVNGLPDSAFACIDAGGEKDDGGRTTPRSLRHYPHHNANGGLDLPHLRNALSRIAQDDTTSCGASHLRAHAKEADVGQKAMAVKFVDGSDTQIEGLAIPFGGPFGGKDIDGEDFGPDVDVVPDLYPQGRPILYHHGLNKGVEIAVQGRQYEHELTAEGIWARGELDKAAKYHSTVAKMIADGKLFFSSGAIPHLVKADATGHITRWPWSELSLTPTPANPEARVYAVKATDHLDHLAALGLDAPDAVKSIAQSDGNGLESEPFAAEAERVQLVLDAFAQRAAARVDARVKAGRDLSAANRTDIADVVESLRPLGETWQRLSDLLAQTDPDATEATKAAEQEYLRFLREQARQNGAVVGAE